MILLYINLGYRIIDDDNKKNECECEIPDFNCNFKCLMFFSIIVHFLNVQL